MRYYPSCRIVSTDLPGPFAAGCSLVWELQLRRHTLEGLLEHHMSSQFPQVSFELNQPTTKVVFLPTKESLSNDLP